MTRAMTDEEIAAGYDILFRTIDLLEEKVEYLNGAVSFARVQTESLKLRLKLAGIKVFDK